MRDNKITNEEKVKKQGFKKGIKNFFMKIFYRFSNSVIFLKGKEIFNWILKNVRKSIRFELVVVFGICFLVAFIFYGVANNILSEVKAITTIEYDYEILKDKASNLAKTLSQSYSEEDNISENGGNQYFDESNPYHEVNDDNKLITGIDDKEGIMNVLEHYVDDKSKIYLTDLDGKILYKVNGEAEEKLDIYMILDKSNSILQDGSEAIYLYPVKINDYRAYLIYYQIPTVYISNDYYTDTNSFLALILSVIVFISIFIIITNKKMKYIDEIATGVRIISSGDLSHRIQEKGKDEIEGLAKNINNMAWEIENRIESERSAEKTKAELITNVSHDLRTPLTSIMGYIGLVKDKKYQNEDMMMEYLNIAFNKSNQLNELIEDLFEYTKINNNGIILEKVMVNIVEFLTQMIEEYITLFEENNIEIVKNFSCDKSIVEIDASKMVRVFENLFSNAIKYSHKPGKVLVSTYIKESDVIIEVKNKGDSIPKEKIERIFDRFYRVDEARNSNIKGSGLGLAISKNIIKLHEGDIWAESNGKYISFYIKLKLIKNKVTF